MSTGSWPFRAVEAREFCLSAAMAADDNADACADDSGPHSHNEDDGSSVRLPVIGEDNGLFAVTVPAHLLLDPFGVRRQLLVEEDTVERRAVLIGVGAQPGTRRLAASPALSAHAFDGHERPGGGAVGEGPPDIDQGHCRDDGHRSEQKQGKAHPCHVGDVDEGLRNQPRRPPRAPFGKVDIGEPEAIRSTIAIRGGEEFSRRHDGAGEIQLGGACTVRRLPERSCESPLVRQPPVEPIPDRWTTSAHADVRLDVSGAPCRRSRITG